MSLETFTLPPPHPPQHLNPLQTNTLPSLQGERGRGGGIAKRPPLHLTRDLDGVAIDRGVRVSRSTLGDTVPITSDEGGWGGGGGAAPP